MKLVPAVIFLLAVTIFIQLARCAEPTVEIRPETLPAKQDSFHGALWLAISDGLRPWLLARLENSAIIFLCPDEKNPDKKFTVEIREQAPRGARSIKLDLELKGKPEKAATGAINEVKQAVEEYLLPKKTARLAKPPPVPQGQGGYFFKLKFA